MDANGVASELERFVERWMVKITLDVQANLTEATPVDTGWARSNWIPRLGLEGGPPAPRPEGGGTRAGEQRAAVLQIAAAYRFPERVTISNNVPYIRRLNDGHSSQAPRGFVQRSIRKALTEDVRGLA